MVPHTGDWKFRSQFAPIFYAIVGTRQEIGRNI